MRNQLEVKTSKAHGQAIGTVLLGHAMFNSFDYFFKPQGKSLVDYLNKNGFDVIAFHLTGYGKSPTAKSTTGFDQYVGDYETILSEFKSDLPLYFIGHSVGGIAGISAIAISKKQFKKIILIAPALWPFTEPIGSLQSLKQKAQIKLMSVLSLPLGRISMSIFGLGDVPAPHGHFYQLNRWSQLGKLLSLDGSTEYSNIWKNIDCPIQIYSGSRDTNMAPPESVRWMKSQIGGRSEIQEENADHFGLIYGRSAAEKMWPKFSEFLLKP